MKAADQATYAPKLQKKWAVDIGCNCGFWSIQARLAGAQSVHGLEPSLENVEAARFILELTGLARINFEVASAYDVSPERLGTFDIGFFLGLLYHLEHPVLGLQLLAEVPRELAVIDTVVVPDRAAICRLRRDELHEQNYDNRLRMVPSRSAVLMMLRSVGFRQVFLVPKTNAELPPDYVRGRRETFVALK